MTQINLFMNSLPRDLSEFAFFLIVGFTAGYVGLIQIFKIFLKLTQQCMNNPEDSRNSNIS